MTRKLTLAIGCFIAIFSSTAQGVYFPDGIDWANPSTDRFVLSLYLNTLGRAPRSNEISTASRALNRTDTSQTRLDLFRKLLNATEYRQTFGNQDKRWQVYQAPDLNYDNGWRYRAAQTMPDKFQPWRVSESSSESVAEALANFYNTYCFSGSPCIDQPQSAYKRGQFLRTTAAHECADKSNLISQFQWIAINGTTYPQGTDANTLCMGRHYYKSEGLVLQHYQCEAGYLNCLRDRSRDIRAQRTGFDDNRNPTLFFSDGGRLTLTNSNEVARHNQPDNRSNDPFPVNNTSATHDCADPALTTSRYRWKGPNGTTESPGIGQSIVCMDNAYYVIDGVRLMRHDCDNGFRNCIANPARDISAERRKRVDGYPGLEFRNGTTMALIATGANRSTPRSTSRTETRLNREPVAPPRSSQPRTAGQHSCADPALRISQFRWTKAAGTTSWPDGVDGRYVCLKNAYYEIKGSTLHHYQCLAEFKNCRANRRKDLIAVRDANDNKGYRTLIFANGDQLSLISR